MDALPVVSRLSRREAIGQVLCPTLFGGPLQGHPFDLEAARRDLERHGWGGFILFHGEAEPTRELLEQLQASSPIPLLVAADMERGAGQQLAGLSTFPPAMALAAGGPPEAARELGRHTAREALAHGVNWILAPVADVNSNPRNPIINLRSFGEDPVEVAMRVAAFVEGCQSEGALACAKHFPGHGDTALDSHTMLARIEADRARLEQVEWPPFRAAIAAGVASIMSAHLALPALGVGDRPATLSRAVMTDLLRGHLGFSGLIVTDALIMGGIARSLGPAAAAIAALEAGCDMLLMPHDPLAAMEALERALVEGILSEERLYEAAGRVLAAKARLGPRGERPLGDPEAFARRIADEAITSVRGQPTPPQAAGILTLDDGAEPGTLACWDRVLAALGLDHVVLTAEAPLSLWAEAARKLESASHLLLAIFSPVRVSKDRSLLPARLLSALAELAGDRPLTVVSFSSPYVVAQFPGCAAVVTFGAHPRQLEAALEALETGRFRGRSPVTLPTHLAPAEQDSSRPTTGPAFV